MTDKVHPTQGEASSQLTSGAIKWAAATDWVVPNGTDYLAAFAGLSGTPLNGFDESHSSSSFDVTIDTGEAFVGGRWCARDVTTTVTLASSTNNQTIYVGWESSTANSVVIGLDSAFSSSDEGRRTELYEADTDGSGVTNVDVLHVHEQIHPHAENADALGGSAESAFAKLAQNETVTGTWYFNKVINSKVSTNDFIVLHDGSDGSNTKPYTLRFDTRDFRLYGGDNKKTVLTAKQNGDVTVDDGTFTISHAGSHISLVESDNNNKEWRIEGQAGGFQIVEPGVEEWLQIDPTQNNRLEAPGGMATIAQRLAPQSSEPSPIQNGTMAVQDGTNWDPAGTGELDLVVYLGSWTLVS